MTRHGPRNVALLSVDALRSDRLSCHGYERETTPRLDELAAGGVAFSTATSASSHTREAVPALITGRHPDVFAANEYRLGADSLSTRLSAAGYTPGAFHSNPYVSRAYGFDRGFDEFFDDLLLGRNRVFALAQRALDKFVLNRGAYHARAAEINERSLSWIDSLDGDRFFLWNHYMDVHGPYNPPTEYAKFAGEAPDGARAQRLYEKAIDRPEELTAVERDLLVDLYDDEVRYLDAQIGAFVDGLRSRGLYEDTLVVVTADHGDGFGEHGYYAHPRRLHDELLRVPLIVPSADETGWIDTPVSTLDVAPTVLVAAGLDPPDLPGTPLCEPEDWRRFSADDHTGIAFSSAQGEGDDSHLRRFCVRDRDWKVLSSRRVEGGEVLDERAFDLAADPGERRPLDPAEVDREPVRSLRATLREHSASRIESFDGHGEPADEEVGGEVESRLEALGYR